MARPARITSSLPAAMNAEDGPVTLAGVPWSWAYSLSSRLSEHTSRSAGPWWMSR
jgi:hypothetical protein